ncbi:MAG TPA: hypothetical protein VF618_28735 [Thermoanaerobaculia bacterium]
MRTPNFLDAVKDNAIPLALVGAGLLLFARNANMDEETVFETYDERSFGDEGSGGRLANAGHRVADVAGRVGAPLQNAGSRGMDMVSGSPLIAGIAAVAVGALIGALIPETEKEHQLLGEHRDQLADRARDLAYQGIDRAKGAVSTATEAARQAAQDAVKNAVKGAMGGNKSDVAQDLGTNARA